MAGVRRPLYNTATKHGIREHHQGYCQSQALDMSSWAEPGRPLLGPGQVVTGHIKRD
jgi:hypothetical protein